MFHDNRHALWRGDSSSPWRHGSSSVHVAVRGAERETVSEREETWRRELRLRRLQTKTVSCSHVVWCWDEPPQNMKRKWEDAFNQMRSYFLNALASRWLKKRIVLTLLCYVSYRLVQQASLLRFQGYIFKLSILKRMRMPLRFVCVCAFIGC